MKNIAYFILAGIFILASVLFTILLLIIVRNAGLLLGMDRFQANALLILPGIILLARACLFYIDVKLRP